MVPLPRRHLFLNILLICSVTLLDGFVIILPPGASNFRGRSFQAFSFKGSRLFGTTTGGGSKLTDWVIDNLEDETDSSSSITSFSTTKAGENDTLPQDGLAIGGVRIFASGATCNATTIGSKIEQSIADENNSDHHDQKKHGDELFPIRLLVGRNGWGTGVHPTTRLCIEWLSRADVIQGGEVVLDYGCGSGVLSIAALGLGASRSIGVDVEAEALVTSERNIGLNGFEDRYEGFHTREIIPYCLCRPNGVDICIANILIGQLCRPSMVSAIISNMSPGAYLCLSGIRPSEVTALKEAYDDYVDFLDDHYAELNASDTPMSIESYGFDVGAWARVVGRVRADKGLDIEKMSELAVS